MADVLGKLTVEIVGDNTDLEKDIKKSKKSTEKFGKSTEKLGKSLGKLFTGIAFAAVAKKLFDLGKAAENLFKVQELAEAKLDATLVATGNAAGLTAIQLKAMATELQGVTTFGDEATIGAQSLLLTFKSIGEDVFPDALESILNVSEAMGQDLKSSTIQIGKALNDPIKGLASLGRVGIQFTDVQKDLIKGFQESGDLASAQGVILNELESQFGGVARAAALTADGISIQLSNAIGDLGEGIGQSISRTLTPWRAALRDIVTEFSNIVASQNEVLDIQDDLADGTLDEARSLEALEETLAKLNAQRAAGAALAVNKNLKEEIRLTEALIAAYGVEDQFLINAAESALALNRANITAAEETTASLELEEQKRLRLAELRAAELTDNERQQKAVQDEINLWIELGEVVEDSELIAELVKERTRLIEEGTEKIEEQIDAEVVLSDTTKLRLAESTISYDTWKFAVLSGNEEMNESFKELAEVGLGSITSGFEEIGAAMLEGGLDAGVFAKLSLTALADVLSALGAQLAAQAALAFFTFPFNIPAGVGLAAGSATAYTASGVIRASAGNFAEGGIVAGSSFSGDNVPAMVNSGEMVLNRSQQAQLFSMANGNSTTNNNNTVNNNNMFSLGNEAKIRQAAKTLFPALVKEGQRRGTAIV